LGVSDLECRLGFGWWTVHEQDRSVSPPVSVSQELLPSKALLVVKASPGLLEQLELLQQRQFWRADEVGHRLETLVYWGLRIQVES
jgi:hypothetical protein